MKARWKLRAFAAVTATVLCAFDGAALAEEFALPAHDGGAVQRVASQVVATWPEGTFLESVTATPQGDLLVSNKEGARIERVSQRGNKALVATLPDGINGLETGPNGIIFATGHVRGGAETLYRVSVEGGVEVLAQIPQAGYLNGVALVRPDMLLIADSAAKTIWRVDLPSGKVSAWLVHDLLGHRDANASFPGSTPVPAANGVKRFRDGIYVSVTDRSIVLRIPLITDGSAGVPVVWAKDVAVDDFAFDAEGTFYGGTHPLNSVVRVRQDGTRSTIATGEQGVNGAAALAFGTATGDESGLYVVGNARIPFQGAKQPGRLIRLQVGVPGYNSHSFADAAGARP